MMANAQNPNTSWQNRPPNLPATMQTNIGAPFVGSRQPVPENMQLKSGPNVLNGPVPVSSFQGQQVFPPPSSVNGINAPHSSQGGMQMNGQIAGMRPPLPGAGGVLMNGPNQGQTFPGNQTTSNQSVRPGFPPPPGSQYRQSGPSQNVRPQFPGQPPLGQGAFRPPQVTGPPRMPPASVPGVTSVASSSGTTGPSPGMLTSSQGMARPPFSQAQQMLSQDRPNELPVPFHGHGQYSRQVGMTLTPGVTPSNSGPPSQRSSRTNSPSVVNQNLDALEGQFRGTPDQEVQSTGNLPQQWNQQFGLPTSQSAIPPSSQQSSSPSVSKPSGMPPMSQPSIPPLSQPGMPPMSQPSIPPLSQPGMPPMSQPGIPPLSQPGIPPMSQPSIPPLSQPGMPPMSQPGIPPTSQPGIPPMSQPGIPPTSQPGIPPMSQPGIPPTSQPGMSPSQRPGMPPMFQQPGMPPTSSMQGMPPASQHQGIAPPRPGMPSATQQRFPQPPPSSQSMGLSQAGSQFPPSSGGQQQPSTMPAQRPGFPPPQTSRQQTGFSPVSLTSQRPGFPPPPMSVSQQPGFPPPPISANQQTGFGTAPVSTFHQPGFPAPPMATGQQPRASPPQVSASQQPGFPPPPTSVGMRPGFLPATSTANQQPGFPPPPTSTNQYLGYQPSAGQQPGFPASAGNPPSGGQVLGQKYGPQGKTIGEFVNTYPKPNVGMNAMTSTFNNMSVQGSQNINLLQQKMLIPPDGVQIPKPVIPNDNRDVNCNPEVFRCTLNNIPQTSALLNKSRLPLGILIHPFKDLSQLPVIQSSVIVRCRSCRTYINPFVYFVDSRRWKCNLCFRVNELPDEFSFDPVTKSYGDPQRRPEIKSATIEFIAPSEYMLRPPQPAVYLYLIDVSFNAIETGYLTVFCETLLDVIDRIPGDSRTQIGFIAYDSSVHFFNLAEGLSQPQMLTVTDVEDIFLPCPDDLLVNLNECKSLVTDLLNQLPTLFENNMETRSALGAALQASFKMMSATGGRVTVMQTVLPTYGPGGLQNREDSTQKTSKDISSLGPATDFYKKLALDCSAQQIAVDLFMFNGQYADLASIECISKFSGGCITYYPSYHAVRSPHLVEKFEADLRRYLTRKIGFESVMRIRCSKGISIHTFHGNFFVRSTDLLSLPNVNPDAGFGMQMSIEEQLTEMPNMCFQAALLYTSSKGERRIRVHTLCLPITNQISEIHAGADQQAIIALLAKMAVDRSVSSSMSDAREAIVNAAIDILNAYGSTLPASQRAGGLVTIEQLKLIPLYCLALLKSTAFRTGISTRLDDRTYALEQCKTLPVTELIRTLYPDLYPVHTIMDVELIKKGSLEYPKIPLLQLSSANIDRNGAYLLDTGDTMYLYMGSAINPQFCQDVLDRPHFAAVQEGGIPELPELENEGSERLRAFITYLLDGRSNGSALVIVREDGKLRMKFFQHFVEDRTESSISYIEFLQQIQAQVKS